jgi:hypothetical protein
VASTKSLEFIRNIHHNCLELYTIALQTCLYNHYELTKGEESSIKSWVVVEIEKEILE